MPWTGSLKSGDFDHVVLLVAAQAVLRAEGGADAEVAAGGERVERMGEVRRHRGGMGEQGDAPARRAARAGRDRRAGGRCRISCALRVAGVRAQSNPRDGSPARPAGAPAPNRTCPRPLSSITADRPMSQVMWMSSPRCRFEVDRGGEFVTVAFQPRFDLRHGVNLCPVFAIILEAPGRPLTRGREIEFEVAFSGRRPDEGFEAAMEPQVVGALRLGRRRQQQRADIAGDDIAQRELGPSSAAPPPLRFGWRATVNRHGAQA